VPIGISEEDCMNVVVLHGSARRGGDTDTLTERFLQGLDENGPHKVTHFVPIDMNIAHCRACMECAKGSGCVIADDMQAVYPAFRDASVVVLASPMFWGYMTSQLKTLLDRLEAVVSAEYFGNKDFVLLIGYRHYYGSMIDWLDRISTGFGSRSHAITCQTFDPHTGRDVPIRELPERLEAARELGQQIGRIRSA
jgi:multimeric flavodoxin WrbA